MAQKVLVRRRDRVAERPAVRDRGSVVAGAFWMFLISLLLFWLPVLGALLGGIVGGKRAGGVGAAILAAFLPAILVAVLAGVLMTLVGLPLIGTVTGLGLFIFIAADIIGPLLLGAVIGGLIA